MVWKKIYYLQNPLYFFYFSKEKNEIGNNVAGIYTASYIKSLVAQFYFWKVF